MPEIFDIIIIGGGGNSALEEAKANPKISFYMESLFLLDMSQKTRDLKNAST